MPLSDSNTTTPYLDGSSTRVTLTNTQRPSTVTLTPKLWQRFHLFSLTVVWHSWKWPESDLKTHCTVCVSHHDGSLLAVVAVELQHVFEGEITDDVRVENEERLVVDVQQLSSQSQGARCTQTSACSFLIFINFINVSQKYKYYSWTSTQ